MICPRFSRYFLRKMIIYSSESIDQIVDFSFERGKVGLPAKSKGLLRKELIGY